MDESVRAMMDRWPDVPDLYGWLSLDEAGRWRLKGEPITHPGLVGYINRNYESDEHGRWFFQNGPQRGFVRLAYTPWVLHVDGSGTLNTHTERPIESVEAAWIDDEGNLLLDTEIGIGLVDAGSLAAVAEWLVDEQGAGAGPDDLESALSRLQQGQSAGLYLRRDDRSVAIGLVRRAEVPQRFGFVADPQPQE